MLGMDSASVMGSARGSRVDSSPSVRINCSSLGFASLEFLVSGRTTLCRVLLLALIRMLRVLFDHRALCSKFTMSVSLLSAGSDS